MLTGGGRWLTRKRCRSTEDKRRPLEWFEREAIGAIEAEHLAANGGDGAEVASLMPNTRVKLALYAVVPRAATRHRGGGWHATASQTEREEEQQARVQEAEDAERALQSERAAPTAAAEEELMLLDLEREVEEEARQLEEQMAYDDAYADEEEERAMTFAAEEEAEQAAAGEATIGEAAAGGGVVAGTRGEEAEGRGTGERETPTTGALPASSNAASAAVGGWRTQPPRKTSSTSSRWAA